MQERNTLCRCFMMHFFTWIGQRSGPPFFYNALLHYIATIWFIMFSPYFSELGGTVG